MTTSLHGKTALITGGASGLGAALCRVLAGAGGRVFVLDRDAAGAEAVAQEIGGEAIVADLAMDGACERAVHHVASKHGAVDILVNNAGIDHTVGIEEMSREQFDRVIAINLAAPFALAKAVFPAMREQGSGHIVNIVSTAAKRAWANASAYHASKWGLLGLSHALHVEARPHGIKVTALLAGGMRTPFIMDRFPDTPPENLQDPQGVAETVLFLLGQPAGTVVPELMVVPMGETSWP